MPARAARFGPVLAALLAIAAMSPAMAALQAIEQAWELRLDQVTLPGDHGGRLVVRRCAGCAPVLLQLTATTQYYLSPQPQGVSLQELLDAAESLPLRNSLLNVFYDPATRRVTRLRLERAP
jgi:hypothetical protein